MKENSIEEDIKDIEKYISFTSKRENFSHDTDWNWNKDLANKIEHILSDYKRVLKENEELKNKKEKTIKKIRQFSKKAETLPYDYDYLNGVSDVIKIVEENL